jgi:C-terminal processing protease CtpA/Prc
MRIRLDLAIAVLASSILGSCVALLGAQATDTRSARTDRLVALCKLWGTVKYFHPYLAYRDDIDWDKALVDAIPKINTAQNSAEYADAVQGMLEALRDPTTRVLRQSIVGSPSKGERQPSSRWTSDKVLVVTMNNYADLSDWEGANAKLGKIAAEIQDARGILFDLRALVVKEEVPAYPFWDDKGEAKDAFENSGISNKLSSLAVSSPGARQWSQMGAPNDGSDEPDEDFGYTSFFTTRGGRTFVPDPGTKDRPVVFVVNARSYLPPVAMALQAAGKAAIVFDGGFSEAPAIWTYFVDLGDGLKAQVRVDELVNEDGTSGELHADAVVGSSSLSGGQNEAFQRGLELLGNLKVTPFSRKPLSWRVKPPRNQPYPDMLYPSLGYRLLAVFRMWNLIHYFFAHPEQIEGGWDSVLRESISKMDAAQNASEYHLALAAMHARVPDGHASIRINKLLPEMIGESGPPTAALLIQGVPVITSYLDEPVAKKAGVEVGDIIVAVNGEDAKARIARINQYMPGANPEGRMRDTTRQFMNIPGATEVRLKIRDGKGRIKNVTLPLSPDYTGHGKFLASLRTGDIVKLMPGNVGYADLNRLSVPMIDSMFEKLRETKGSVFDLRGYPHGTVETIIRHLPLQKNTPPCQAEYSRNFFPYPAPQPLSVTICLPRPPIDEKPYRGKIVVLMNEICQSWCEGNVTMFKERGATLIGSHTADAEGSANPFYVPGGIPIMFSSGTGTYLDGQPRKPIGLVPDIEVKPTILGIRSGRDEVLDRAVQYLQQDSSKRR